MPLTLHAAEISKGRTVSQLIPYCQPQANPHEGSINLTMYMVKAPLMGYITASSARACIIRYLISSSQTRSRGERHSEGIHVSTCVFKSDFHHNDEEKMELTNNHEGEKDRCRTSTLERAVRSNEQASTDSTTSETLSASVALRRTRFTRNIEAAACFLQLRSEEAHHSSFITYIAIICMCLPLRSRCNLFWSASTIATWSASTLN